MIIKTPEDSLKSKDFSFVICSNKGFHIRLTNGWTVSVQFGIGNYCDNYNNPVEEFRDMGKFPYASNTAEVWSWNKGKQYPEDPLGYQTPKQVLEFINKVNKFRP